MTTAALTPPRCPEHGDMVLKHGRTGEFYSCTAYPACRRTAPVRLDLPCPRCRAPLVVRVAKKSGKKFTGCSSWPTCSYMAFTEPHTCASCGRPCLGPEGERAAPSTRSDPAIGGGDADDVPF